MAPDNDDDLLFVEHALRRGLVSESQVDEIMRIQEKVAEMGVPDSIPALMVKRGVLKSEETDRVVAPQVSAFVSPGVKEGSVWRTGAAGGIASIVKENGFEGDGVPAP